MVRVKKEVRKIEYEEIEYRLEVVCPQCGNRKTVTSRKRYRAGDKIFLPCWECEDDLEHEVVRIVSVKKVKVPKDKGCRNFEHSLPWEGGYWVRD